MSILDNPPCLCGKRSLIEMRGKPLCPPCLKAYSLGVEDGINSACDTLQRIEDGRLTEADVTPDRNAPDLPSGTVPRSSLS